MVMLILAALLLGLGGVLDSVFRLRMSRIGQRWALLQGGAFDYSRYHKVREENGWAAWPVYLMWAAMACGIALLIVGFLPISAPLQREIDNDGPVIHFSANGVYQDLAFILRGCWPGTPERCVRSHVRIAGYTLEFAADFSASLAVEGNSCPSGGGF